MNDAPGIISLESFDALVNHYKNMTQKERSLALINNALDHARRSFRSGREMQILLAMVSACTERGFCSDTITELSFRCFQNARWQIGRKQLRHQENVVLHGLAGLRRGNALCEVIRPGRSTLRTINYIFAFVEEEIEDYLEEFEKLERSEGAMVH